MSKVFDTVTGPGPAYTPIAGAYVTVKNYPSGTLASLTNDAGVALPNPLQADLNGAYSFNAADGQYLREFRISLSQAARSVDLLTLGSTSGGGGGTQGPQGPQGPAGATGATGPAGTAGPAGTNGKTILSGTVNPSNSDGTDGDLYYNTASKTMFGPKAGGAWPSGIPLNKFWVNIAVTATGGSQTITLGEAVAQDQVLVFVNGARKLPATDYTVSGTTLTITATAGALIYVSYLGTVAVSGPPVNSSPPVVTGTAQQGQTLTVNPGAWTNLPNALAYQWYRNDTNNTTTPITITGEVGVTYLLSAADVGFYVYCVETASNGTGSASQASNILGAVVADSSLTAPVLTLTSSAGNPPEWTIATLAEYMGLTLEVQQTATAGNYTSPAQDVLHMIIPSDIANGAITNADMVGDGWADPSGAYGIRARIVRDDGATSAWSNEITGSVTVSVATWSGTTGNDKSQYLTASNGNLTLTMNNAVGANCGARATISASGKRYFETTVVSSGTEGAGSIALGVTDDSTALGAAVFPKPGGASGGGGAHWRLKDGSTITTVNRNGSEVAGTSLTTALADGDLLGINFDTTANTVTLFHKPGAGAWYQVQQVTLTSQIPTNWRAYGAGFGRTGAGAPYDAFTTNFGATAFNRALDTGYSFYG